MYYKTKMVAHTPSFPWGDSPESPSKSGMDRGAYIYIYIYILVPGIEELLPCRLNVGIELYQKLHALFIMEWWCSYK